MGNILNIDNFDNTTLTILILITTNIEILLWSVNLLPYIFISISRDRYLSKFLSSGEQKEIFSVDCRQFIITKDFRELNCNFRLHSGRGNLSYRKSIITKLDISVLQILQQHRSYRETLPIQIWEEDLWETFS